eukprot:385851-Rhodomonas_salina.1
MAVCNGAELVGSRLAHADSTAMIAGAVSLEVLGAEQQLDTQENGAEAQAHTRNSWSRALTRLRGFGGAELDTARAAAAGPTGRARRSMALAV